MDRFSDPRRLVVKVGTNTLFTKHKIDQNYLCDIARQIVELRKTLCQVFLVTSGATGMGASELGITEKLSSPSMRQACASIGQPLLMQEYRLAFSQYKIPVSQILLTYDVLSDPQSFSHLWATIETLIHLNVMPIFNENDPISITQTNLTFGDNDRLSALLASRFNADLLIILSDVDGLYDKDPHKYSDVAKIHSVQEITAEILEKAQGGGSTFSTGGMQTKLQAAMLACENGCPTVLACGREKDVLLRLFKGENLGTLFFAKETKGRKIL